MNCLMRLWFLEQLTSVNQAQKSSNDTLKALGVSASETVFVGDTLDADIEGAKAVGMKAIYIQRRIEKVGAR